MFGNLCEKMWHFILLTSDAQRVSAPLYEYPPAWSKSINQFKMAAIVRCDLDVSEKHPFQAKMVAHKCISANDICKFISKKEIGLTLYAIMSMQNKSNPFLHHPTVLDCRKPFLLQLHFTLNWHHKICK